MNRLYWRIFLAFWLVIVIIVCGAIAVNIVGIRSEMERVRTETLQASLDALTEQAQRQLAADGPDGLRRWLQAQAGTRPVPPIFVVGPDGREILDRPHPPPPGWRLMELLLEGESRAPAGEHRGPPSRLITGQNGERYVLYVPRRRPPPGGWFFQPEGRIALLFIALLGSASICFLVARQVTRPIQALREAGARIGEGDFSTRVSASVTSRHDELGMLGREFNRMAERIQALIAGREQLLRDVSHELRSPLARLQAAVGLARQRGTAAEADFARIEREADRLNELIGQILSFSRVDNDQAALRAPLDLAEVVAEVVEDARYEGRANGRNVELESEPAAPITGDEVVLRSAIENVLRNALQHAAATVQVKLVRDDHPGGWRVIVHDDGPGVAPDDLPRLFEPFYTGSRPGTRGQGSGLGLAIARRAMQLHGGSIELANDPRGGFIATLKFASR